MDTPCKYCGAALILQPVQKCPNASCVFNANPFSYQSPCIEPLTPEQVARVVEICAPGFVFET